MHGTELAERAHGNLMDFWRVSPGWSSTGHVLETGSVLLYATGTRSSSYRGAFRVSCDVAPEELLDHADDFFLSRGLSYAVRVRDTGHDDDLRAACRQRGMRSLGAPTPEMAQCGGVETAPVPQGMDLHAVTTRRQVVDLSRVCAEAYGMPAEEAQSIFSAPDRLLLGRPDLQGVVAYFDGRAVAAGQTLMGHGVGGVYWIGVVDRFRCRGIGELISRTLTNIAFERGALACTLQASSSGESVYRRVGYRTLYSYEAYWRFSRATQRRATTESARRQQGSVHI